MVHLVNMRQRFAPELQRLQAMAEMGLVKLSEQAIQVTATGWFFVRGAAMVFDKHLQFDPVRERVSRMI